MYVRASGSPIYSPYDGGVSPLSPVSFEYKSPEDPNQPWADEPNVHHSPEFYRSTPELLALAEEEKEKVAVTVERKSPISPFEEYQSPEHPDYHPTTPDYDIADFYPVTPPPRQAQVEEEEHVKVETEMKVDGESFTVAVESDGEVEIIPRRKRRCRRRSATPPPNQLAEESTGDTTESEL